MKHLFLVIIILCIGVITSCNKKSVKDWSDNEIEMWFENSNWNTELKLVPDTSIDIRSFVEQNILNPEAWKVAYNFLSKGGFDEMELGKYDLDKNGTYVNIEEYITKDSSHFEAHRKYIDIQYLAKGKEYIRVSSMDNITKQVSTYNESKDIEFFDKEEYMEYLLDGSNFMVLFPHNAHMPCMKADSNMHVRKVVVKIPIVM